MTKIHFGHGQSFKLSHLCLVCYGILIFFPNSTILDIKILQA